MTKQRSLWHVVTYEKGRRIKSTMINTEDKAKSFLETLDVHGFVYYGGVAQASYSPALTIGDKIIVPARWRWL